MIAGISSAVDLTNPATLRSLLWLVLTPLAVAVWTIPSLPTRLGKSLVLSIVAADLMAQNLAWGLGIEIDDWTLVTFGTSDIMGAVLDRIAPADTIVHLNDKTRFAACRSNTLRKISGRGSTYLDRNLASNAMYGDLLFLRPGRADNYPSSKVIGWSYANCKEPRGLLACHRKRQYFRRANCRNR